MDKHYGFIYLTIDLKNGKGYIGQHKMYNQKTLDPDYIGSGVIISNIKKKYGLKRFNRQILCFCESEEELNEMEIYYINYFNAVESENFYNIAEGGYKNPLAGKTIEEMKIISNKISAKVNGEKNAMYGKNAEDYMTQEAIIEKRKNQSIAQKKRFKDKKEREKCASHGESHPMYGKGYKISGEKNGNAKGCYCKELNMQFTFVELAIRYCKNILGLRGAGGIKACCRGCIETACKLEDGTRLHWEHSVNVDQETLDKAEYIDSKKYEELLSQNVNDCK